VGAKGRADSPRSDGAVGFFDSGLGGLCILDAFVALCPNESTVYIADSANCPYGNRPADEIVRLSRANTEELLSRGCKMVVVACNTATAAAIDTLRAEWPDVPFIGIEPALKPAALESKTGIVGVLATAGTFGGRLYRETKAKFAKDVTVIATVADEFVEIVESIRVGLGSNRVWIGSNRVGIGSDRVGIGSNRVEVGSNRVGLESATLNDTKMTLIDSKETLNDAKVISTVRSKIEPLLNAGCDRIVLGCTHFPHLKPVIEKVCAGRAEVIDPSDAVARQARRVLARLGLLRGESAAEPSHVFISSKPHDPQMGYGARTADML
jgi:glutamate racemase